MRGISLVIMMVCVVVSASAGFWSWLPWKDGKLSSDEIVEFYFTYGYFNSATQAWTLPIHAHVFEREEDSVLRNALMGVIAKEIGKDATAAEKATLKERLRPFVVDNESDVALEIVFNMKRYTLDKSDATGHVNSNIMLTGDEYPEVSVGHEVKFAVVDDDGSRTEYWGTAKLVQPEGIAVISDIDDTIKVTEVLNRKHMLANTFYREFRATAAMSEKYSSWVAQGAIFFYLSGSPWQLHQYLKDFLKKAGYPEGEFILRPFYVGKPGQFLHYSIDSSQSKQTYKKLNIAKIMQRFPKREFILVGDSGEFDPEVYGEVARTLPERVKQIIIRQVQGSNLESKRFETCFKDISQAMWSLVSDHNN